MRQPSILSRITRVRRRKRASPIQPRTNHTAIHSWPMLLHGHSCHWCLSKLYKLLLPYTRLYCHVTSTIGWRLLARFQNGATCLGANKALAIQAASCIFSRPPRPPPWPELVSYIRKLVFQSSSFTPLDRTSTTFV